MRFVRLLLLSAITLNAYAEGSPPVIYMIGDSTMADKAPDVKPETGWGEALPGLLKPRVRVENHARNGRSSKSFLDEGRWQPVVDALQPGDYVIIQFGHNDEKAHDPARYTRPRREFRRNIERYVRETRAKGAIPILATPICRRVFSDTGQWQPTHGEYPGAIRAVGRDMDVPVIDLQANTKRVLELLGPDKSKTLYLHAKPGAYDAYPQGVADNTHLNGIGARRVAELFELGVREQGLPLAGWFQ